MKKLYFLVFFALISFHVATAQVAVVSSNPNSSQSNSAESLDTLALSDFNIEHLIIGGSIGAGGLLSSNVINSGAFGEYQFEVMVQAKHHRFGIGGGKTLMISPENLGTVLFSWGENITDALIFKIN